MAISSTHPLFNHFEPLWIQLEETSAGQAVVKAQNVKYLPPTGGMMKDGGFDTAGRLVNRSADGAKAYLAYLTRAVYHNMLGDAIVILGGILHRKPASIKLPKALEPMLDKGTLQGESLQALLRRMTEALLTYGRIGLMLDVPSGKTPGEAIPFIVTYDAQSIRNWDNVTIGADGRRKVTFIVLDESGPVRNADLQWVDVNKYRLLAIMPAATAAGDDGSEGSIPDLGSIGPNGIYHTATFTEAGGAAEQTDDFLAPEVGGKSLDSIPFVFVNAQDTLTEPDNPPLMSLSDICLAIYRLEADYRHALFMQGQATLYGTTMTGKELDNARFGAGGLIEVMAGQGVDLKYVEVSGQGLGEFGKAIDNDKKTASQTGARMMDFGQSSKQSAEALSIRMSSSTANLVTIARTAAEALQAILRMAAEWISANPEEVIVEPNLDFAENDATPQDLLTVWEVVTGGGLSLEDFHKWAYEHEFTVDDFETFRQKIEETRMMIPQGTGVPEEEATPGKEAA